MSDWMEGCVTGAARADRFAMVQEMRPGSLDPFIILALLVLQRRRSLNDPVGGAVVRAERASARYKQ